MAEYRLHCFAQSGNAYKAALALTLAGADWEPVFVDFFNGAGRSPEFRAVNEMAEVPVLDHGKVRLSQSGAILDYLVGQTGKFKPKDEAERLEVLRWVLWDNHKFTSYTATWRFLLNFVPPEKRSADVLGFLEARARGAYALMDNHLKGRNWIVGDHMTAADLSCIGYMFFTDEIPVDFDKGFPNLAAWRERIRALPGWQHPYDMMPGHPIPGR